MAKRRTQFICQSCGAVHARWSGRCDACGGWNTIVEEDTGAAAGGALGGPQAKAAKGRKVPLVGLEGETLETRRLVTGIGEFDRVTGGGLVPGSAVLVGGDPGIGKSTLLIQAAGSVARKGGRVVYVSGEEAVGQVRLRAQRLGLSGAPVQLAAETNVDDIVATLSEGAAPDLVIIDSIQTLWTAMAESAPGTVTQVRASAQTLIRFAKNSGAAIILVGHVTKDGQIAGPRVVEHMVDAVLSFEGDRTHLFRILRGLKNRFGPTDEIGVFEMGGEGLRGVPNPSELFLGERSGATPGAAVFAGVEGTRPLLVEIQALVAPSPLGTPRRAVVGWDSNRLSMVLAVLEAHCGLRFGGHDVYLAVSGGMRLVEPAADLAVAAALVSSLAQAPLAHDDVFFGEIGLSGAVRAVPHAALRLKEAARLGFSRAHIAGGQPDCEDAPLTLTRIDRLDELAGAIVASGVVREHSPNAEDVV
ncbi:MAG: DNA repair protein RadA [Hyphomicrobiaceae bacterium]|nr:DNA repair protein RadA [Hyphomicrobiaceae bacterium]